VVWRRPTRIVRTVFGRSILLGLEFLVAADIIRTVAVQPSLENVAGPSRRGRCPRSSSGSASTSIRSM